MTRTALILALALLLIAASPALGRGKPQKVTITSASLSVSVDGNVATATYTEADGGFVSWTSPDAQGYITSGEGAGSVTFWLASGDSVVRLLSISGGVLAETGVVVP